MISQYWKGQIPNRPISIQIKQQDGTDMNLTAYTDISAKLIGSDNEEIDLTGSVLNTSTKPIGKLTFSFPTDRSLFTQTGDYVFQIVLAGTGKKDFTSTHTFRVRELGGVSR